MIQQIHVCEFLSWMTKSDADDEGVCGMMAAPERGLFGGDGGAGSEEVGPGIVETTCWLKRTS